LRIDALPPATRRLLEACSQIEECGAFTLIGGTALALVHGHRLSEDLDFACAGAHLDRIAISKILDGLRRVGFDPRLMPNEDARQEAEIGGLDLDDFQQDWEADGTKITFVALAAVDPTGTLKDARSIPCGTIRVADPSAVFSLKALALTDRTRSRDLFDVWFFLTRLGYSMEQFATEVARMKRNYPFESVKSRLVSPVIPKFDPGFQPLIDGPRTVDELVDELRAIVDAYEIREATRFAERQLTEGPAKSAD
jgi:predicted nucleotidyltransferase component of viral defense system